MADDGDKTEQPTQKKLDDARKKGQLPRSKEAGTFCSDGRSAVYLGLFILPWQRNDAGHAQFL